MRSTTRKLLHDERGMSFVYIGLGFMGFLAATTLAVDVGFFMTARSQAQNAADAGALAGAVALAFDSYTDRSPEGPAVQSALSGARANQVMREAVSIGPADVTFPLDPRGQPNRVRVAVYRSAERGNAVRTLMATLFGVKTGSVTAAATAEVAAANAATCVMPFALPDKWVDHTGPKNCFEAYEDGGARRPDADDYSCPSSSARGTGYGPADIGTELRLRQGDPTKVAQPFFYFPVDLPASKSASDYRENVAGCNTATLVIGDALAPSSGNREMQTRQGVDERIARDPVAYWDGIRNRVVSSMHPSPRVVVIPLFDPDYYDRGRNVGKSQPDLKIGNFMGLFLEQTSGGDVFGRITPIEGDLAGPPLMGGFARVIRLVQ